LGGRFAHSNTTFLPAKPCLSRWSQKSIFVGMPVFGLDHIDLESDELAHWIHGSGHDGLTVKKCFDDIVISFDPHPSVE
jgi:hypothetical protein